MLWLRKTFIFLRLFHLMTCNNHKLIDFIGTGMFPCSSIELLFEHLLVYVSNSFTHLHTYIFLFFFAK